MTWTRVLSAPWKFFLRTEGWSLLRVTTCETDHSQRLHPKSSIAIGFVGRNSPLRRRHPYFALGDFPGLCRVNQGKPKVGDVQGHPPLVGVTGLNPLANKV